MGHRIATRFPGDLDVVLADQRPRQRGAEQIGALVDRGAPHRGKHKIADELLAGVANHAVDGTGRFRLFGEPVELLFLADVAAVGDDLAAVLLDQPAQDDRGVEAAAVGEAHPSRSGFCHALFSRSCVGSGAAGPRTPAG